MSNFVTEGYAVPHPPLIIPEVGKGREQGIADTIAAYQQVAEEVAAIRPDTIVLISSHVEMYGDYFHIAPGESGDGNFGQFGAPQVKVHAEYDTELRDAICRHAQELGIPAGTDGQQHSALDHGTMIPLYFINQKYSEYKVVRIGISGLSYDRHMALGACIRDMCEELERRTVVIASGDLSHKLKQEGPYGYAAEAPEYDRKVMEIFTGGKLEDLQNMSPEFCRKAAECGHRTFLILAGMLQDTAVTARKLSYEGPFGVGYGVCAFDPQEKDPYVRLAKQALETYVKEGTLLPVSEDLDEELLHTRAGAFVSLHMNGELRGCIGTATPVRGNVAQEIIENAISAGAYDMRFDRVTREELPAIFYSVDVLGPLEHVKGPEELDEKRYGVIVSDGMSQGLLLPNLAGVDSVQEQLEIAQQKANIMPGTPVDIYRFEVVRHV